MMVRLLASTTICALHGGGMAAMGVGLGCGVTPGVPLGLGVPAPDVAVLPGTTVTTGGRPVGGGVPRGCGVLGGGFVGFGAGGLVGSGVAWQTLLQMILPVRGS